MYHLMFHQRSIITCVMCNTWFLQVTWPFVNWRNWKCLLPLCFVSHVTHCYWIGKSQMALVFVGLWLGRLAISLLLAYLSKTQGALEGTCYQKLISHRFGSKAEFILFALCHGCSVTRFLPSLPWSNRLELGILHQTFLSLNTQKIKYSGNVLILELHFMLNWKN